MTQDNKNKQPSPERPPVNVNATADQVRRLVDKLKSRPADNKASSNSTKGTGA